jgi:hypothetical protein
MSFGSTVLKYGLGTRCPGLNQTELLHYLENERMETDL